MGRTQEREDITHFAMEAVRKIHYGKIHELLDMSKLSQDELKQKENQVPEEEEYFVEGEDQSQLVFDVNRASNEEEVTEEDAAAKEEELAREKEEGLKAEKEKGEEAMRKIEAKEAEMRRKEEEQEG